MSEFATSVERLHRQVRHWEQPRWSAAYGAGTLADRMHALIQQLADLGAEAEGRAPREVPREHDMVLPDQLLVVADDLVAAAPGAELLTAATAAVDDLRRTL